MQAAKGQDRSSPRAEHPLRSALSTEEPDTWRCHAASEKGVQIPAELAGHSWRFLPAEGEPFRLLSG